MDVEFWSMFFKIIVFLPFILFLIYLSLKYGGTKLQGLQNSKYMKIVEKISLSKDNSLMVVKIGNKGYLISSTNSNVEILQELAAEELADIESKAELPQFAGIKDMLDKFRRKKEE